MCFMCSNCQWNILRISSCHLQRKKRTEGAAGAVAPSGRVDKGSWVSTSCPDCLGVQCWTALWILRFHESFVGGSRTPGRTCCTTVQWTAWWTTSEKSPNPSVGLKSPGESPCLVVVSTMWLNECKMCCVPLVFGQCHTSCRNSQHSSIGHQGAHVKNLAVTSMQTKSHIYAKCLPCV